ncbi:MAG: c-type cytochrome [Sulfurovum sp.]|nr:c-type cytochrome [Sulfurovum sp.]
MLLAGSTLLMAEGAVVDGAAAYAKCAGCHGANGEKSAVGKSAIITGQDAAKTIEQLNGYKAGTLNLHGMGGMMKGQVATMDDATIKAIADHIAGLK